MAVLLQWDLFLKLGECYNYNKFMLKWWVWINLTSTFNRLLRPWNLSEFDDDIHCFMLCFYSKFGKYDTVNGLIVNGIKDQLGSQAYSNDSWMAVIADGIIEKCLSLVVLGPTTLDTLTCNPDIRTFATCYWNHMFNLCPKGIKNQRNCLVEWIWQYFKNIMYTLHGFYLN